MVYFFAADPGQCYNCFDYEDRGSPAFEATVGIPPYTAACMMDVTGGGCACGKSVNSAAS